MDILKFIRRFSLPMSIVIGTVAYLSFSRIEALVPIGDKIGPFFTEALPVLLFFLLYVTFCKIQVKEMKPRKWHFILQAIRISASAILACVITFTGDADSKLILEGVFICVICPTAAAAPVVAEKLGGNISSLTIYTIIANIVTAVIIPLFFPMIEKSADIGFLCAMLIVLNKVTMVLVAPLILALVSRKIIPTVTNWIKLRKNLAFYLWNINLIIVTGVTWRNILQVQVASWVLALLLILPLLVAVLQFAVGKAVGHQYGESVTAGQALGQKNTVVGIWLTITFLNPLAAVAPGAYVLWQNMINAWQLWYKDKYGAVKW